MPIIGLPERQKRNSDMIVACAYCKAAIHLRNSYWRQEGELYYHVEKYRPCFRLYKAGVLI